MALNRKSFNARTQGRKDAIRFGKRSFAALWLCVLALNVPAQTSALKYLQGTSSGGAAVNGNGTALTVAPYDAVRLEVRGTGTWTLTVEVSDKVDGTGYTPIDATNQVGQVSRATITSADLDATSAGSYVTNSAGEGVIPKSDSGGNLVASGYVDDGNSLIATSGSHSLTLNGFGSYLTELKSSQIGIGDTANAVNGTVGVFSDGDSMILFNALVGISNSTKLWGAGSNGAKFQIDGDASDGMITKYAGVVPGADQVMVGDGAKFVVGGLSLAILANNSYLKTRKVDNSVTDLIGLSDSNNCFIAPEAEAVYFRGGFRINSAGKISEYGDASPSDGDLLIGSDSGGVFKRGHLSVGVGLGLDSGDGTVTISLNGIMPKTITASGTTGAQTINLVTGAVNFAAAATSLVVTNSLVDANSVITCTVGTNDTTMKSVACVVASGSFTIYPNAAPTAETRVYFRVSN